MKKVLSFLLALTLVFALSACDENTGSNLESSATPTPPETSATAENSDGTPIPSERTTPDVIATPTPTPNNISTPTAAPTSAPTATPTAKPTDAPMPYGEDMTLFTTTWTHTTLEQDLQNFVTTNEFTYGTPPQFTYSLRHMLEKYSVLGYNIPERYVYDYCVAEATSLWLDEKESFEDDNNEKILNFNIDISIPFKTDAFIQNAVARDAARAAAFFEENIIFISFDGSAYNSFESIPAQSLAKLYAGTVSGPLSIVYPKGQINLSCEIVNGQRLYRTTLFVNFK